MEEQVTLFRLADVTCGFELHHLEVEPFVVSEYFGDGGLLLTRIGREEVLWEWFDRFREVGLAACWPLKFFQHACSWGLIAGSTSDEKLYRAVLESVVVTGIVVVVGV